ncbi:uncharacterized protein [Chelonus insularis]|uniref:uncharacterized protein n=1 Tax=Chelonus insularis TaxID=460826 RepID=UPI00158A006B|nr:uncharacterized protein LOC118065515 [Chelonus insularis]
MKMKEFMLMILLGLSYVPSSISSWDGCGGRLERALDAMQRDSARKNKRENEDQSVIYQQKLTTAPFEMTVTHLVVKVPAGGETTRDSSWARVEKCHYEPSNNSLRSRVMLNDLSVSGIVSITPSQRRLSKVGESCRMSLRLKRAGIEFFTSPIARSRGQMRIRTESSFLEPRFASIYAYGCRPTSRMDRQIKRHDKPIPSVDNQHYEVAEPRQKEIDRRAREEDIIIANDSTPSRFDFAHFDFSPTKKTFWITKLHKEGRKRRSNLPLDISTEDIPENTKENYQHYLDESYGIVDWQSKEHVAREMEDIFLRGASEALTKYIEHELHPAIKETLMISMGYTISYG